MSFVSDGCGKVYLILFSPVGLGGKPAGGLLEKSSLILEKEAHTTQNRFKSARMARIKKQITTNVGQDLENSEPSYITLLVGMEERCSHLPNSLGAPLIIQYSYCMTHQFHS